MVKIVYEMEVDDTERHLDKERVDKKQKLSVGFFQV